MSRPPLFQVGQAVVAKPLTARQAKLAARLFAAAQQVAQEPRNLSNFFDDMNDDEYAKLEQAWYDLGARVLNKHGLMPGVRTSDILIYVKQKR